MIQNINDFKTASAINALNILSSLGEAFNQGIQALPSFAEYNTEEQKKRREASVAKTIANYNKGIEALKASVSGIISTLDTKINKLKYPLLMGSTSSFDEALKLRSNLEYQNAVALIKYLEPDYPITEIYEYYSQMRYDFVSHLIDLSLKRKTMDTVSLQKKEEFRKEANKLLASIGVIQLMAEKTENGFVLYTIAMEYQAKTLAYSGTQENLLVFATANDMAARDFKQVMASYNV